jgi:hypothetical protein
MKYNSINCWYYNSKNIIFHLILTKIYYISLITKTLNKYLINKHKKKDQTFGISIFE